MSQRRIRIVLGLIGLAVVVGLAYWGLVGQRKAPRPGSTLRVVGLFPMTGPGASLGEYLRHGIELAQEDIATRYAGQLHIEVEIVDSKNQPREAVSALQASLVRSRPDALIAALSSVSKAIVPIVERENLPTIVTTTALTDITKGTRNVIRIYPTSGDFICPVAEYMAAKYDRLAVIYIRDDFGESNQRVFGSLVQAAGKRVTAAEPFDLMQTDARSLIARVLASNPQAVFVTGYGPAFITIFKQLKEARKELPIYTEIGFANPAVLEALGKDADGIIFDGTELELSEPASPAASAFRSRYVSRFGKEPYQVAGFARDSLVLFAETAMKAGGSTNVNKQQLVAMSPFACVMGSIVLDSDGECRIALRLMKREKGRTVFLQD